eukprot:478136_1
MKKTYLHKYSSVDTTADIGEHDPTPLSPVSKLVYKQWRMDNDDHLLMDGYYRKCDMSQELPPDIRQTIIDYYIKKQSKGTLKRKIMFLKEFARQKRKEKMDAILHYILIFIILTVSFGLIFGSDIAALVIVNNNDCDLALENGSKFLHFGVFQYLLIGSVFHIVCGSIFLITVLVCVMWLEKYVDDEFIPCLGIMIVCGFISFFISWSVVGAILYSEMDQSTSVNKQCSDMVLSWVILKLLLYIFIVPFVLWFVGIFDEIGLIVVAVLTFCVLIALCSPDIAGLVIISRNNCDIALLNVSIDISITEFLYIGCVTHIACMIVIPSVVIIRVIFFASGSDWWFYAFSVLITGIFFLSWSVIGSILYSNMDERNAENKQCSDMVLAWVILKFIECISLKPFVIWWWVNSFD